MRVNLELALVAFLMDNIEVTPEPTIRPGTSREEPEIGVPTVTVVVRTVKNSAGNLYVAEVMVLTETPVVASATVDKHEELEAAVEAVLNPRVTDDVDAEDVAALHEALDSALQEYGLAFKGAYMLEITAEHNEVAFRSMLKFAPFAIERL